MFYSKEEREDYERRFNGYIMKQIKYAYKDYLRERQKRKSEISLFDTTNEGIEIIETIIGDKDIEIREIFAPEEIELIFEDDLIYKASKSLTDKEKLAIFLCFVLNEAPSKIAQIMGYADKSAVNKLIKRSLKKIRRRVDGYKND